VTNWNCLDRYAFHTQTATVPLIVAIGNKVPLLGRNWLEHIKLNWSEIFAVHQSDPLIPSVLSCLKTAKEKSLT